MNLPAEPYQEVPPGSSFRAGDRIDQFIVKDYPKGRLTVVVGFMSLYGLVWLSRRTHGRVVTLLFGEFTGAYSGRNVQVAVEFVDRLDVDIYEMYGSPFDVHSKDWAVRSPAGPGLAVLVGSANLTKKGLYESYETVVEAKPDEGAGVYERMLGLVKLSRNAKPELRRKLTKGSGSGQQLPLFG